MKTPIVILHGWGLFGNKYFNLQKILEKNGYKVYAPDLPGFGNESILKKEALDFNDYILFVNNYLINIFKRIKEKKVIFIGHSFGGRIAIRFTSLYPNIIEKLILTGASGIPHPLPSLRKKILFYLTKILRPFFILPIISRFYKFFRKIVYYSIGEMDYYKAGNLIQTFKNVYKISIKEDLKKIIVPTLLIWGENDTFIPVADGQYMHEQIKNSKLIILPNEGHGLPYKNPEIFSKIVINFLKDK